MSRRLTLVAAQIIFLGAFLGPHTTAAAGGTVTSVLIAHPSEGHIGDPIWLSGSGFPPKTVELFAMVCPRWDPGGPPPLGTVFKPGAVTDEHGRFKGWELDASPISQVTHPMVCTLYASVGRQPFGPAVKPIYTFLPSDRPLDRCETQMCHVSVIASPRRLRSGVQETIDIRNGWPGAIADISVVCRNGSGASARQGLDWEGKATAKISVHCKMTRVERVASARVRVHLSFAHVDGDASARFTIVR
ncbi:MAG: hypothetical protein ACR2JC_02345 [Chloroflexota bacterium]